MDARDSRRGAAPAPTRRSDPAGGAGDADLVTLFCPTCAADRLVETPPCPDGHGADCPDRACVECGTALMLDAPLLGLALGTRGVGAAHARQAMPRRSA